MGEKKNANHFKEKPTWLTQEYIREKNHLLFEVKVGSQAYGTATPASDIDLKGVFLMPDEAANSIFFDQSWETLTWNNGKTGSDKVESEWVSLRKFLHELLNSNPGRLEMAFSPEDCIIYLHEGFKCILESRQVFLTKKCEKAFAEYAAAQIRKARGQNKMQNYTKADRTREKLTAFCFTAHGQGACPILDKMAELDMVLENCGLVKVDHMRDVYSVFYDRTGELGYKGLLSKDGNNVTLSSVKRNAVPVFQMQFNTDAWAIACGKWKEYETWEATRNDDRWIDVQNHNQKIDGKNMLHCVRLIDVAIEIAIDNFLHVRRTPAEVIHLLNIKKGNLSLEQIIEGAEQKLKDLSEVYAKSGLPDSVDPAIADALYWKSRSYVVGK